MSNHFSLFAVLQAQQLITPQEEQALFQAGFAGQVEELIGRDDVLRGKLERAFLDPGIAREIGEEAFQTLRELVRPTAPSLGPGVSTRWSGAEKVLLELEITQEQAGISTVDEKLEVGTLSLQYIGIDSFTVDRFFSYLRQRVGHFISRGKVEDVDLDLIFLDGIPFDEIEAKFGWGLWSLRPLGVRGNISGRILEWFSDMEPQDFPAPVALPSDEEVMEHLRVTDEKTWHFKRTVRNEMVQAHRELERLIGLGEPLTLDIYTGVMEPLLSLVGRAREDLKECHLLLQMSRPQGWEELAGLKHDFYNDLAAIELNEKITRSAVKREKPIKSQWLLPPSDVGSIVDKAKVFFKLEPGQKTTEVRFHLEIPDEYFSFRFKDQLKIEFLARIFFNLASNAAKYFDPSKAQEDRFFNIGAEIQGDRLVFVFKDNGLGMTQKFVDQYYGQMGIRAPEVVGKSISGTGYGASIVKKLVEKLGGIIEVESALGKGTTHQISLPLALFEGDSSDQEGMASDEKALGLNLDREQIVLTSTNTSLSGAVSVFGNVVRDMAEDQAPVESGEPLFNIVGVDAPTSVANLNFRIVGANSEEIASHSLEGEGVSPENGPLHSTGLEFFGTKTSLTHFPLAKSFALRVIR